MEDLYHLMAAFQIFRKQALLRDASERFDKRALLQIHDDIGHQRRGAEAEGIFDIQSSSTDPRASGNGGTSSPVPLERLKPISFSELQAGKVHRGRVVYGTLCAEAFRICGTAATLIEDDNGLAVRLAIYNASASEEDIKKLYPSGAKVAVKEPYFKIATDGGLTIRVDNPASVVKLKTEKGKPTENLLHVDVEEVRKEGNRCFREQNWDAAAEHYTKCIDVALLQFKESSSNGNNDINKDLLHSYSNRAETWLQMKEFKWALEDSDEALAIDPGHLKALYRKGRALVGLRHYAAACELLEKVDRANPGQREIKDALGQAKNLYAQSRNGKYDISDYLLGLSTSSTPEVADFVGPVEIKMTEDGRGRGLYATRKIRTGELLLVDNAVAVAYESTSTNLVIIDKALNKASQGDLLTVVVCKARKSQRLLRQLYSLQHSSMSGRLDVPDIDLFKTGSQEEQNENLQVDVTRIRDIISLNYFGGGVHTFVSKSKFFEARIAQQFQAFGGLWLLPSFINHSCLPNSKTLEVGSAMFIHASKPIQSGEEITISYFDTFIPLPQRQAKCNIWGFKCKCRRCILEHSLRTSLEPVTTARFEQLHDKAEDELIAASSGQQPFNMDLPACAEFARLSVEAEEIIRTSNLLKTEEEKNWIRASFVSAYLAGAESPSFIPTKMNSCFPAVLGAIQSTDPGNFQHLSTALAVRQLKACQRLTGVENKASLTRHASDQAREACICVFGRHKEKVLKALVLKYSK